MSIQKTFAVAYQSRKALNSPPHITLQAPFAWPLSSLALNPPIEALTQGLGEWANDRTAVPIQLSGFGAFAPRVIYIKVQQTPELLNLYTQLQTYCAQVWSIQDTRVQSRPFVPHMTVAFRDLTRPNFHASWSIFQDRQFDSQFIATDMALLKHNGQCWQIFDQVALGQ